MTNLADVEKLFSQYFGQYNLYLNSPEEGKMTLAFMDNMMAVMQRKTELEKEKKHRERKKIL